MDDFEELRRLLLGREQDDLKALREQIQDEERRTKEVASVLPEAVQLSRDRSGALTRALQPAVQGSIKDSIESKPEIFVNLLYPLIGPIVRRSIADSLRGMMQSLNTALENTFSWKGLKWRFEALRTGKSFADVALLRSLKYRVEQVFLIHRDTSLLLLHVSRNASADEDSDMDAGMLSAIQDLARDRLKAGDADALEAFRVGDVEVWITPGLHVFLAAVIHGNPPEGELRTLFSEAIDSMQKLKGSAMATFSGNAAEFACLRPQLEDCLREQRLEEDGNKSHTFAWIAVVGTAALMAGATVAVLRSAWRWHVFQRLLNSEPGLAITDTSKGWIGDSLVVGLRDPLAGDPRVFAIEAGLNPESVRFEWKDYYSLDAVSVRRRFEKQFTLPAGTRLAVNGGVLTLAGAVPFEWLERVRRETIHWPGVDSIVERDLTTTFDPALVQQRFAAAFPAPPGVTASVADGTLTLAGKAPYEWIAPVREGATRLPGITAIVEKELEVEFKPALVLRRFEDRFGLPDTVNAAVGDGTLMLSGEASHRWLDRVREGAPAIPGIKKLDATGLTDLDQQTYQQAKSVIESAFIYFLINKDAFATEGFAALSRLPDEIRRCRTAGRRIGVDISIEIRGYADSVGAETKNIELSSRRANAVRDFLVSCGLDSAILKPLGLGQPPPPPPGTKPLPEQADRRVSFSVSAQPISPAP